MKSPLFDILKEEKYRELAEKEISQLFYCSLFDDTHFHVPGVDVSSKRIRRTLKRIIRRIGTGRTKRQKKYHDEDYIINKYFFTGRVCNFMIADALCAETRMKWIPEAMVGDKRVDIALKRKKFCVEIKRTINGGNLGEYIEEISGKAEELKDYKFLLVILFICNTKDEVMYLEQITSGFKNLFRLLKKGLRDNGMDNGVIPSNLEFFVCGFSEDSSFSEFIGKLINRCKELNVIGGRSAKKK